MQSFCVSVAHLVLLSLTFAKAEISEELQVYSMQSGPLQGGSIYPSAVIYDLARDELHLLSNVDVEDGSTACSYQTLQMKNFSVVYEKRFGDANDVCHNLHFEETEERIYMVGHSANGGMLEPLQSKVVGGIPQVYGMVVDIETSNGTDLQGGHIISGHEYVYPFAVATWNRTVYTASLYSSAEMNESEPGENPSDMVVHEQTFSLLIEANELKPDYVAQVSEDYKISSEAFVADSSRAKEIVPENDASISNVAGILTLDDSIFVAGSTNGFGNGLGVAGSDGTDMDGFVLKLSHFGDLASDVEILTHSYRVKSTEPGHDEFINGMCKGELEDVIYLTGSSSGRLKTGNSVDGKVRAILIKLNVTTMEPIWIRERAAYDHRNASSVDVPAEGIACHVSHEGGFVYMAGNVYGGGTMMSSKKALSLGGSDVFVAKFHTIEERMEWIRQIGSTGDEKLAPRGGLAFTHDLGIVLFGQTNGDLYRERGNESSSDVFDYFVSVIDHDGAYPDQIQDQTAITEAPTIAPSTVPPTAEDTVQPGCSSENCESYDFLIPSVRLRIEGVGKFNDTVGEAFSQAIKKWYEDFYHIDPKDQHSPKHKIHQLKTEIGYWGQSVVGGGSIITYNQSLAFDSDHDNVDYDFASALIVDPLLDNANKADLLKSLSESHEAFKDATAISGEPLVPEENRPKNAAGSANLSALIWVGAIIFGLCVCWGVYSAKHLDKRDETEEYDEKNDVDTPEAPLDLDLA